MLTVKESREKTCRMIRMHLISQQFVTFHFILYSFEVEVSEKLLCKHHKRARSHGNQVFDDFTIKTLGNVLCVTLDHIVFFPHCNSKKTIRSSSSHANTQINEEYRKKVKFMLCHNNTSDNSSLYCGSHRCLMC